MVALTKRNLKLYFSNKMSVFFSMLGALIAFGLYIIFLQKICRILGLEPPIWKKF